MYGTVAHVRLKPGAEDELKRVNQEDAKQINGFVFEHFYRLDSDPSTIILVIGFASKKAYLANANSPQQHARYQFYRALMESDPIWHDGEIVYSFPG